MNASRETARRVGYALYALAVVCSLLIGGLVVIPFYAYGIPAEAAGNVQQFDVKQYWPFGFEGPGAVLHDLSIALAFVAPLIIPATVVWGILLFVSSESRHRAALVPVILSVVVGVAYGANWRAILAWHLD